KRTPSGEADEVGFELLPAGLVDDAEEVRLRARGLDHDDVAVLPGSAATRRIGELPRRLVAEHDTVLRQIVEERDVLNGAGPVDAPAPEPIAATAAAATTTTAGRRIPASRFSRRDPTGALAPLEAQHQLATGGVARARVAAAEELVLAIPIERERDLLDLAAVG